MSGEYQPACAFGVRCNDPLDCGKVIATLLQEKGIHIVEVDDAVIEDLTAAATATKSLLDAPLRGGTRVTDRIGMSLEAPR